MSTVVVDSGLRIGSLSTLRIVLEKWQLLNSDPILMKEQGAPWWYNERATLSVFAGAVWQSQGWVLEEFSTEKVVPTRQHRRYKPGRCDILFSIKNKTFIGEAKQCWPTLTDNLHVAIQSVHDALDTACKEALENSEIGYPCLGMVFIAPCLHESKKERTIGNLQSFVTQLLEIKGTTIAWVFPKAARSLQPDSKFRNYIFPGVALVMQLAG
jgi:hypothetical protein